MRTILALLAYAAAAVHGQDPQEQVRRCTVKVTTVDTNLLRAFELRRRNAPKEEVRKLTVRQLVPMRFAGIVISSTGEIVAPAVHPRASLRVIVEFYDGKKELARVVGTDPMTNLALLQVPRDTPAHLELATADARVGDGCTIVGNGLVNGVVSKGMVTQESLRIPVRDLYGTRGAVNLRGSRFLVLDNVIAVTGTVARPMPGSPCVDSKGRLVGMIFAFSFPVRRIETRDRRAPEVVSYEMSLAVPARTIAAVVKQLREKHRVIRAHFGIHVTPVSETLRAHYLLPVSAAAVSGVDARGPAGRAGLKNNDVILRLGGKECSDFDRLAKAFHACIPGEEVTLTVLRGGKTLDLKVTPIEQR